MTTASSAGGTTSPGVLGHGRGLHVHVRREQRELGVAHEGRVAREHVVEHRAERVDVAPLTDVVARHLLGRHVLGRPHERAAGREVGLLVLALDQAEIEHLHELAIGAVLDQHDVAGLEVAMHQAVGVSLREGSADLKRDAHGAAWREGRVGVDELAQRAPVEQLHGDEAGAVVHGAVVVHRDGVGVRELGHARGLEEEAIGEALARRVAARGVAQLLDIQDLQRDLAPEVLLNRAIEPAHAATREGCHDAVASRDQKPQEGILVPKIALFTHDLRAS